MLQMQKIQQVLTGFKESSSVIDAALLSRLLVLISRFYTQSPSSPDWNSCCQDCKT
jgi:hypothetical protein